MTVYEGNVGVPPAQKMFCMIRSRCFTGLRFLWARLEWKLAVGHRVYDMYATLPHRNMQIGDRP